MSKSVSDEKGYDKEELNQVFQGKFMREGVGFFDTLFFNYAKPLLDSAMTQRIRFE